ncbi:L-lactate dehydrogenase [Gregarina niphandrodes]|uniref:L-lactate dehydrogenase n=1 Tax=Gregarina niphandrodes TaxID=110365 RepID=A0A023B8Q6_GRENI|nr:L-lactate dehydrogenase [Gregarina niphandrodes]EZG70161.1 L-lactate dehydrogenase [Gregarina niphandrodes]|eukprot:XP_011129980.1 L-lactate dehydrogenase [Gregarina niphandrodes]
MAPRVPPKRVSVIGGGGMVGAATVNALILKDVAAEVLIVDVIAKAAEGQALDIADASFNSPGVVRVGSFAEAGQSDLVIITAGYPQKPGEPRSMLLKNNKSIIKSICEQMQPIRPDLKILVVANPVDVLTHLAWQYSGLPKSQVFGSGTYLDSGRLRSQIASMIDVHPRSINAYVLGEHGDRQFVAWSAATIQNTPLLDHPKLKGVELDSIRQEVMRKAYAIIDAKRSTYFGIGMCSAKIAECVLNNTQEVFPLVHWVESEQAYISWPCTLGSNGVDQTFHVPLNEQENKSLKVAVDAIKDMVKETESIEEPSKE